MSVKILSDNIKSKNFSTLYYIYGEEEYLKNYYYNELKQKSVTDFFEFNIVEFDNKNFDYLDFCNSVNSYPVMAEHKFVGVIDFDNSMINNEFTSFLKNIPQFCTVAFFDTEVKKATNKNVLEQAITDANGVCVKVSKPTESSLAAWVTRHFKKNNKTISTSDVNYIIAIADNDMRLLSNEINKLCSYVSGDTITRSDIEKLVTKSIEANRFEISDAFCHKDYDKVLDIVDKLYKQNVDDIVIANIFYRTFTDLWKAKVSVMSSKAATDLKNDFGINQYGAMKLIKNSQKLSFEFLETGIALSKQLDINLKSTSLNQRDLITVYIADLIDRRQTLAKA